MKKAFKRLLASACVLAVVLLVTWGICETAGSDYYNYKGYITDIHENEKGDTVIAALSGTQESEFTVKWYTRNKNPKNKSFSVGECVMLSTTHYSDTDIKKIKTDAGYSTEGKLFYADIGGNPVPFALSVSRDTGVMYLVKLVSREDIIKELQTGDTVRLYHASPANQFMTTAIVDSAVVVSKGSIDSFDEAEMEFIKSQGYSLKTN